ncbi:MAG: DUF1801 domain-containing protein [Nitrososphaerales archaeon]|jgi:hypothetical protein
MPSSPSQIIDKQIAALHDWRGETMAKIRRVIHEADPEIVEELKWKGTPVFSHDGVVVLFKPFNGKVKLTFAEGAPLPDPKKLFNSMLEGNRWRAIDFHEGDKIDEPALKDLVRAAVARNASKKNG